MWGLFPWCRPSPSLLSPGSGSLGRGVGPSSGWLEGPCAPARAHPGSHCKLLQERLDCVLHGDSEETSRRSHAAGGGCAACARFPWDLAGVSCSSQGRTARLPAALCSGTSCRPVGWRWTRCLSPGWVHPLSLPCIPCHCHASPRDLASHEGRVAQCQYWWGRALALEQVRPGQRPQPVLVRHASLSPSGA